MHECQGKVGSSEEATCWEWRCRGCKSMRRGRLRAWLRLRKLKCGAPRTSQSQTSLRIPQQPLQPLSLPFPPHLPQDPPMRSVGHSLPSAVHSDQWTLCSLLLPLPVPPYPRDHMTMATAISIWPKGSSASTYLPIFENFKKLFCLHIHGTLPHLLRTRQ